MNVAVATPGHDVTTAPPTPKPGPAPMRETSANRPDVLGLPTGTARLVSAAAASLAAVAAAWVQGSGVVGTEEVVSLGVAVLLLFSAVRLGLRAQTVLGFTLAGGLVVSALGVLITGVLSLVLLVPAILIIIVSFVTPRLRMVGKGIVLTGIGFLAAIAWTQPAMMAVGGIEAKGGLPGLLIATAAAIVAWVLSAIGRRIRLHSGALAASIRNALFWVVTLVTGIVASLWLGTVIEADVNRVAFDGPLESLAPTAAWLVTGLSLLVTVWTAVRLPRWLVNLQMRGRIEARVTGETLLFAGLACAAAFAAWRYDESVALGRACVVGLAAAGAYGLVRIRYGTPLPLPNHPLWVVALGHTAQMDSALSSIAAEWNVGQVTLLAAPSMAARFAAEHLHAADLAGAGQSLFPQRAVYLDDWEDAQPAAWRALPTRELYAPFELWSKILADRVEPDTRVLILGAGDLPTSALPLDHLSMSDSNVKVVHAYLMSASNAAAAMRPDMTGAGLASRAEVAATGQPAVLSCLRSVKPAAAPVIVRHIMVQCADDDLTFADDLAGRIHGARDSKGRVVECWVSTSEGGSAALLRVLRMPGSVWRSAMLLAIRLLEPTAPNPLLRTYLRIGEKILASGWHGSFEIVVIERSAGTLTGMPTVADAVGRGTIAPVIAIRLDAAAPRTYPASAYAGQIGVPTGRTSAVAVGYVAQKLLATDLLPLSASTLDLPNPSSSLFEAQAERERPRPFILRSQVWRWAIVPVILLGIWLGDRQFSSNDTPPATSSASAAASGAVTDALAKRQAGDVVGAVEVLTTALSAETDKGRRVELLRDRAFAYKLLGRWNESIADLTQVIAVEASDTDREDRIFADLNIRDIDAAIADYRLLSSSVPRVYSDLIAQTQKSTLFVYLPVGATNGPANLPDAALPLNVKSGYAINLRFWWYPIAQNEVRFTDARDRAEATSVLEMLRGEGLKLDGPVLMSNTVQRSRRIEVWLTTRNDAPRPSPRPPTTTTLRPSTRTTPRIPDPSPLKDPKEYSPKEPSKK